MPEVTDPAILQHLNSGARQPVMGPPPAGPGPLDQARLGISEAQLGLQQKADARAEAKTQQEQQQKADDATAKRAQAMESSAELMQSLEKARGLVSGWSTGFGGWVGQHLPWSDQANQLETVINQEVRGNIFKNWVDQMKAQSTTGGTGIGRIMQSEIPLITGALGALDPVQMGEHGTQQSIDQIQHRVLRLAAMANNENPDDPNVLAKYRKQFLQGSPSTKTDAPAKASGGWGQAQVVGH